MAQSQTNFSEVILKDDALPLLNPTILNQVGIEKGGQDITFNRLVALKTVLASVDLPPNPTTLKIIDTLQVGNFGGTQNSELTNNALNISGTGINPTVVCIQGNFTPPNTANIAITDNTQFYNAMTKNQIGIGDMMNNTSILLDALSSTPAITLSDTINTMTINNSRVQFNNSAVAPYIECNGGNQLFIEGNTASILINAPNTQTYIGDVNNTNNATKLIINDALREVDINSVDITSNFCNGGNPQYILPIQFTMKFSGGYSYNNPSTWELVRVDKLNIPIELFTQTNGFQTWKMDFHINCRNMTDQTNKEYAMYIEIVDNNGTSNVFNGFLFNQSTPFTCHLNPSTYSASSQQSENYFYTDYFDFSAGVSASPLEIRLWRYANGTMSCDCDWLLTLSKTNILP